MKPAPIDYTRSRTNPWGFSVHQCCALRLFCKYGNSKQVWAETDIPTKTVQHHIEEARKVCGRRGHDVRLFIDWDRWARNEGRVAAA